MNHSERESLCHNAWHGVVAHATILAPAFLACCCASGCSMRQESFASPDEAARALVSAIRSENESKVVRILGRGAEDIVASGDEVADREARENFLRAFDEHNSLESETDGSVSLVVGRDQWPMPIPLVDRRGRWRFDTDRGRDEILNRRIGRNELSTREVCLAFVDAQREYFSKDRNGDGVLEYAQKLISVAGQQDGLYWETGADKPPSPMGPLVAEAVKEGYGRNRANPGERRPYHGYYFKLLKSQGSHAPGGARGYIVDGRMTEGFAVIAWPAEYGNSGIMSFLVSRHGVVYERDLGRRTEQIASSMEAFDPDPQWSIEP